MRFLWVGLLGFMCLLAPSHARAEWVEAKSENFVFYGDVKAKDAESLVRDLEVFRRNIFEALVAKGQAEPIPVQIYAIRDKKQIKHIFGASEFAGLYQMNLKGPSFILNSKKRFRRGGAARKTTFHEYTHHLIAIYTQRQYPRWFNEGYAEYLSTHKVENGMFKIGAPDSGHIVPLKQRRWFPMDVLIGSLNQYPFSTQEQSRGNSELRAQFYAQSWLAVHYIMSHDEMRKNLRDYLSRLEKREDSLAAFTAAFEMSPEEFGKVLKAYFKRNKYKTSGYKTDFDPDTIDVTVRELDEAAGDFHFAEAARRFQLVKGNQSKTEAVYAELSAKGPLAAQIYAGRAELKAQQNNFTGAEEDMEKALAIAPDDLALRQRTGEILVRQYGEERKTSQLEKARGLFADVLAKQPNNPVANYHYAVICGRTDCPLEDAARAALLARSYYRHAAFAGTNLNLAGVLFDAEEYGAVQDIASFAIIWGQDPSVRMGGQMVLRQLKNYTEDD